MDTIKTQIISYGPQAQLERQLVFFLTHKENVEYRFNQTCWVTHPFRKLLYTYLSNSRFTKVIMKIDNPTLHCHTIFSLYVSIKVYFAFESTYTEFLIAKNSMVNCCPQKIKSLAQSHLSKIKY